MRTPAAWCLLHSSANAERSPRRARRRRSWSATPSAPPTTSRILISAPIR